MGANMDDAARSDDGGGHRTDALVRRFARDGTASTAIEYALIATGIGVAIMSSVYALGNTVLVNFYQNIAAAMNGE
jgi:Flp pilus assembly pilin Flp